MSVFVEYPIAIYSNGAYQATDIFLFALADQAASFCRSISPSRLEPSATSTVTLVSDLLRLLEPRGAFDDQPSRASWVSGAVG